MNSCNKSQFELDEINIVGGDYKEFYWQIKDEDRGQYIDCNNLKMNFSLIEYNQRYGERILAKECEVSPIETGGNEFKLILTKVDTQDLVGKYIYQITINTPNHKQESMQGIMNIRKNINPKAYSVEEGVQ